MTGQEILRIGSTTNARSAEREKDSQYVEGKAGGGRLGEGGGSGKMHWCGKHENRVIL